MKRANAAERGDQKRVRFGDVEQMEPPARPNRRDVDGDGLDILGRKQARGPTGRMPVEEPEEPTVDVDKKHTLDSDEEDATVEPKKLDVKAVHGQEKETIEYDGSIKIMPFNMNEEMEEGHYDDEGNFVFDKKKEEIHDEWLDNVDWDSVKQKAGTQWHQMDEEGEESTAPKIDGVDACERVLKYLVDDKLTVNNVLKTMNSKKNLSAAEERKQRWAAKKSGVEYKNEHTESANELTGAVDNLVSLGHMDAYNMNKEAINGLLEEYEIEKERADRAERMRKVKEEEEREKAKAEAAAATDSASLIKDLMGRRRDGGGRTDERPALEHRRNRFGKSPSIQLKMPANNRDEWEVVQRRMNTVFSLSAEGFRLFMQYGFVPLVVYLGAQKPAMLPTGEQVPFSIAQIFYG
ncbi:Mitochondrial import receptor subunit TOM7-like protein [Aphelenchoides fujianensis]|nr:Mitochondrial import receptor subunit TOM7-like protein [Aphelenchoides fujianensis]